MIIQTLDNGDYVSLSAQKLGEKSQSNQLPEISIRHAELADCKEIHQLLSEPQIIYWTAGLPFASIPSAEKFCQPDPNQYALVAASARSIIGFIMLSVCSNRRMRHVGQIGSLAVSSAWQGYGVGSRLVKSVIDLADNWLNLRRLELLVYSDNKSGIALYTKYGFEQEGLARQLVFRAGEYVDTLLMGRLHP